MSGHDWSAFSSLPSYPVIGACVGFFALPPTVTWTLLGRR